MPFSTSFIGMSHEAASKALWKSLQAASPPWSWDGSWRLLIYEVRSSPTPNPTHPGAFNLFLPPVISLKISHFYPRSSRESFPF